MATSNDPTATKQWAGHLKNQKVQRELAEAAKGAQAGESAAQAGQGMNLEARMRIVWSVWDLVPVPRSLELRPCGPCRMGRHADCRGSRRDAAGEWEKCACRLCGWTNQPKGA